MKFEDLMPGYILKFSTYPYYNLLRKKLNNGKFEVMIIDQDIDASDPRNKNDFSKFRFNIMKDGITVLKPDKLSRQDMRVIMRNIL